MKYTGPVLSGPLKGSTIINDNDIYRVPLISKTTKALEPIGPDSAYEGIEYDNYVWMNFIAVDGSQWGFWTLSGTMPPVLEWANLCWQLYYVPKSVFDMSDTEFDGYEAKMISYGIVAPQDKSVAKLTPINEPQWVYRWWFHAAPNADRYDLFVTRAASNKEIYVLGKSGNWLEQDPYSEFEPCLSLSGQLVYSLTAAGALREKRNEIADILTELVDHIVNNTVTELLQEVNEGAE
jgi:hypothetical protein